MGAFWFKEICYSTPWCFGSDSKPMELHKFFPTNSLFLVYFGPNFFLQLANGGFRVRILCVIAQPPKPTFLLNEIQDGLTDRRFGVTAAVHFRCGCVDCLHEFVT